MKKLLLAFSLILAGATYANTALLEACNSIDDKDKRLTCLKELSGLKSQGTPDSPAPAAAANRVKNAFAAIAGVVNTGTSLNNYSVSLLEPAKELEIFRQQSPRQNQRVIALFDEAMAAYKDAEKVWHASIYLSSDGGLFVGKLLRPQYTGLQGIVDKYNLPTTTKLFSENLSAEASLPIIWRIARERAQAANTALENPAVENLIPTAAIQPAVAIQPIAVPDRFNFQWPATGTILNSFGGQHQGLDIDGKLGDPVVAARAGVVVYAGSKLNGYGHLIIIKHDDVYLTAYGHNDLLLVKEGETVGKGQVIAKMGSTESDRVKLYFEIRQHGTAIDPLPYLPPN